MHFKFLVIAGTLTFALAGCTSAPSENATSGDAVTAAQHFDWNAVITQDSIRPQPLEVSVHFAVEFTLLTRTDAQPATYTSPSFVEGKPSARIKGNLYCYALGTREGTFRGTGPYRVTGTYSSTSAFPTHTATWATLGLARNPEGIHSLTCRKRADGQVPDLRISFNEMKNAFADDRSGAYISIEETRSDEQAAAAATPEQIEAETSYVAAREAEEEAADEAAVTSTL